MEQYTLKQFHADIRAEAEAIRHFAKKEERGNLSFAELEPANYMSCIYGQMTGDCFSERASEIIYACCKRYFRGMCVSVGAYINETLLAANGPIVDGVGSVNELAVHRRYHLEPHYSSIEAYIVLPGARNENLIAYLKGETDTLEF